MADDYIRGSIGSKGKRLAKIERENPENIRDRVYQKFGYRKEEHTDASPTPIPRGTLRAECGSKSRQVVAFAICLTEADIQLLWQMGIRL